MEEEISSLYKVIDDANLTKAELEQQMESMRSELRHLEQNHEQVHQTRPHVALFHPTSFAQLYISSVCPRPIGCSSPVQPDGRTGGGRT